MSIELGKHVVLLMRQRVVGLSVLGAVLGLLLVDLRGVRMLECRLNAPVVARGLRRRERYHWPLLCHMCVRFGVVVVHRDSDSTLVVVDRRGIL